MVGMLGFAQGRNGMPGGQPTRSYYRVYGSQSACRHCAGVIRHERWCLTRNPQVAYAYQVIADPSRLSLRDQLILHALGVCWTAPQPQEAVKH